MSSKLVLKYASGSEALAIVRVLDQPSWTDRMHDASDSSYLIGKFCAMWQNQMAKRRDRCFYARLADPPDLAEACWRRKGDIEVYSRSEEFIREGSQLKKSIASKYLK